MWNPEPPPRTERLRLWSSRRRTSAGDGGTALFALTVAVAAAVPADAVTVAAPGTIAVLAVVALAVAVAAPYVATAIAEHGFAQRDHSPLESMPHPGIPDMPPAFPPAFQQR